MFQNQGSVRCVRGEHSDSIEFAIVDGYCVAEGFEIDDEIIDPLSDLSSDLFDRFVRYIYIYIYLSSRRFRTLLHRHARAPVLRVLFPAFVIMLMTCET